MKEEAISKIKKVGKVGHTITKVLKVIMMVAAIAILVGGIICAVLPKDLLSVSVSGNATVKIDVSTLNVRLDEEDQEKIRENIADDVTFSIENVEFLAEAHNVTEDGFEIKGSGTIEEFNMRTIVYILICAFILVVSVYVMLIFANRLFKAFMDCNSPFEDSIIKCMKDFAIALIPWSVISTFAESIIKTFFIGNSDVVIGVDMSVIFVVLIIFALIQIFKYGAMLQQESDETL